MILRNTVFISLVSRVSLYVWIESTNFLISAARVRAQRWQLYNYKKKRHIVQPYECRLFLRKPRGTCVTSRSKIRWIYTGASMTNSWTNVADKKGNKQREKAKKKKEKEEKGDNGVQLYNRNSKCRLSFLVYLCLVISTKSDKFTRQLAINFYGEHNSGGIAHIIARCVVIVSSTTEYRCFIIQIYGMTTFNHVTYLYISLSLSLSLSFSLLLFLQSNPWISFFACSLLSLFPTLTPWIYTSACLSHSLFSL